jgi:hypothetical protein
MLDDPGVDAIFVHVYVDHTILEPLSEALGALQRTGKAAALWAIGDASAIKILRARVEAMHIPLYTEIVRAVKALGLLVG